MSSVNRAPHTAPGTVRRIRDTAIAQFARHGFTRTTVRQIAAAAGVSPGLVIHHFGSKEGLRTACDDEVFASLTETKREHAEDSPLSIARLLTGGPLRTRTEYLLASLLDPSEHGQRYFDHYVEAIERYLDEGFAGHRFRQSADRRGQATMLAMLALAPLMLESRARSTLGTSGLSDSLARISPHLADLYQHGILEPASDGDVPDTTEDRS